MAHKGSSGASLGGGLIRTRKAQAREKNPSPCPVCGAGKGQPCFEPVPGRGLKDLKRTHRSSAPS